MDTKTIDKKFLFRSAGANEPVITRTEGAHFFDDKGKRYLDLMSGWCVGNLGWGNAHLRKVIRTYKGPDYVYPRMLYKPWAELAQLLAEITPGKLQTCFRTTGGSESVDTAMQIAMAYTGRRKFLSIENSYHGNSIGPLSIGASEARENISSLLPSCHKIRLPLNGDAVRKVETKLKQRDIAAFIMEPVLCNLGVHIPELKFMQELRRLCTRYGTLLVIDEVATGFGRTGRMFGIEHYKTEPDVMCFAKGITGGYAPLGATITTPQIAKKIAGKVNIYSTYGWHPLAADVALANIRYIVRHQTALFQHVDEVSQYFRTRLSQMPFADKGRLNIVGLAVAVDVAKQRYAEQIVKKCMDKGMLISSQESSLVMFPSLQLSMKEAKEALDILESCV